MLAQQPRSCNPPLDSPALRQSCSGRASADPALTSHRGNVGKRAASVEKVSGGGGGGKLAEKRLRKAKTATLEKNAVLGFPLSIRPCESEGGGTQLSQQRLTRASKAFPEDIQLEEPAGPLQGPCYDQSRIGGKEAQDSQGPRETRRELRS